MKTIDLREYYPELYENSCMIEVSDSVFDVFREIDRKENAHLRQVFRYHAHYSLDRDDGIENALLEKPLLSADLYDQKMMRQQIHDAICSLPEKQAKRIYAHFYLDMSITEIAREEKVSKSRVSESIAKGLRSLNALLKESC